MVLGLGAVVLALTKVDLEEILVVVVVAVVMAPLVVVVVEVH
jgi:hypothetical protein